MSQNKIYPRLLSNTLSLTGISITSLICFAAVATQPPANELDALSTPQNQQQAPLSELDALSQRNDDPFGDIIVRTSRQPVSVTLRALDKVIARTIDIEVPINTIAEFGTLQILPRFCDKRPPEDFPETTTFLEIFNQPYEKSTSSQVDASLTEVKSNNPVVLAEPVAAPTPEGERVFSGWMFASSPGLNALEHPVYDVWVIDCKTQLVENNPVSESVLEETSLP